MGWLLLPTYLLPMLAMSPWLGVFVFYFAITLRLLGRVPLFAQHTFTFLRTSSANRLKATTSADDTMYTYWIVSYVGVSVCMVIYFVLFEATPFAILTSVSAPLGAIVAVIYSPWYHDMTEITGERAYERFRQHWFWDLGAAYFNLNPLYFYQPPEGADQRDELLYTLKQSHTRKCEIDEALNLLDAHSLQQAYSEPHSLFTSNKTHYRRRVEHQTPQARRPIIYAAHPHGLAAITGVFGAAFYGTDAMLPDAENVRVVTADILFTIPILRELALAAGCISASPQSIGFNLQRGRDVFVFPGGTLEQAMTHHGKLDLVWSRLGFCRMAYDHEATLVPIVALGETDVFVTFNLMPSFRLQNYRRYGYAFPFVFVGPFPSNVTPVIGMPIKAAVAHVTDADRKRVEGWLQRQNLASVYHSRHGDESSDGDSGLVDLKDIARNLQFDEILDPDRVRNDYFGIGYEREDRDLLKRSSWYVFRESDGDDDAFTTVFDQTLDRNGLLRSGHISGLQRAFYAQYCDIYHLATMALPKFFSASGPAGELNGISLSAEAPGGSLNILLGDLHRTNAARRIFSSSSST